MYAAFVVYVFVLRMIAYSYMSFGLCSRLCVWMCLCYWLCVAYVVYGLHLLLLCVRLGSTCVVWFVLLFACWRVRVLFILCMSCVLCVFCFLLRMVVYI